MLLMAFRRFLQAPSPSRDAGPSLSRAGEREPTVQPERIHTPLLLRERKGPDAKRWEGDEAYESTRPSGGHSPWDG